jgi:hypothetical protein
MRDALGGVCASARIGIRSARILFLTVDDIGSGSPNVPFNSVFVVPILLGLLGGGGGGASNRPSCVAVQFMISCLLDENVRIRVRELPGLCSRTPRRCSIDPGPFSTKTQPTSQLLKVKPLTFDSALFNRT